MIRPEIDDLIAFLNELIKIDPEFVTKLVEHRPECNAAIAGHPTVQVGSVGGVYHAGLIGVLNGYLGTIDSGSKAGWGALAGVYAEDGQLSAFVRLDLFNPKDILA